MNAIGSAACAIRAAHGQSQQRADSADRRQRISLNPVVSRLRLRPLIGRRKGRDPVRDCCSVKGISLFSRHECRSDLPDNAADRDRPTIQQGECECRYSSETTTSIKP
ncbi:hypothetical protein RHECNPAF_13600109 [Rhizobium etli CNPAF512]|nr:hypothetical protein RHECNPAF_13600109 [Rhizobium etli CNPAF512]